MTEQQLVEATYYGFYGGLISACIVGIAWAILTVATSPKEHDARS